MTNGRIISREPGLIVAELWGAPRERGLAHGTLLGPEIALMRARLVSYLHEISLGLGGRILLWMLERRAMAMEPYIPEEFREEMRGIAEGSGQTYKFICLINTLDDVLVNLFACSAFAVGPQRSADGRLIVGRNLDYVLFHDLLPKLNTVFKITPESGRPFVSAAWPGFAALVTGMNDAGIFLADLTSLSRDRTMKGMPALMLNRLALQYSDSLDGLMETIRRTPRTLGKNILIAAAEGARVLEVSAKEFAVRDAVDGFIACTNHYETPGLAKGQGKTIPPPRTGLPKYYLTYEFSKERMDKIASITAGRALTEEDVKGVLSAGPVANEMTVQSVVYVPETKRLLVAVDEKPPVSQGKFKDLSALFLRHDHYC